MAMRHPRQEEIMATHHLLRRSLLALVALGVTIALGGWVAGNTGSEGTPGQFTVGTLQAMARNAAANADDPGATSAEAVLTTASAAITESSGDYDNTPDVPAFLVQIHGKFVALDASVPSGAGLPTGTYLTFIVDASDGVQVSWGLSDKATNLAALGMVFPLVLSGP
jgi:hypothetical protein